MQLMPRISIAPAGPVLLAEAVIISTTKSLMFRSTIQFHVQKRDHLVDALCLAFFVLYISKCFGISPMVERQISNYAAKHAEMSLFFSLNIQELSRGRRRRVYACVCRSTDHNNKMRSFPAPSFRPRSHEYLIPRQFKFFNREKPWLQAFFPDSVIHIYVLHIFLVFFRYM